MTVSVKVAFDGTDFHGSQVQKDKRTVFGEFQKALLTVVSDADNIKGCSRTDSGVHARCYYFSFTTNKEFDLHKFPLSLNANLPKDIRALSAKQENDDFHARYSAKFKEYTYYIKNDHIDDPFTQKYYYRFPRQLDIEAMQEAAGYFVGTHDFRSFMARWSKIVDCTRTVTFAQVEKQGDMVIFKVRADGYLYNMVRIMVGTLIWAGTGKIKPSQVSEIIEARNRFKAGVTVPPTGLFLTDVIY